MSARSVRANALLPGWVDSEMWASMWHRAQSRKKTCADTFINSDLKPELKEAYLKDTPSRRVADPSEVADAAIFLAANGFANNCVLNLDGGLSAT